jgi:hypothetical protein
VTIPNFGWSPGSGPTEGGERDVYANTIARKWRVVGASSVAVAETLALSYIPQVYRGHYLSGLTTEPRGAGLYFGTANWSPFPKFPGSIRFNFDGTGGSVRAIVSKSLVAKYGTGCPYTVGKPAPVSAQDDQPPDGVDVVIPYGKCSLTFCCEAGTVNEAYVRYVNTATALTNKNPWRGYNAGEVLFTGPTASGTQGGDSCTGEITFNFVMSPNATIVYDGIDGNLTVTKKGHELADPIWAPAESGGHGMRKVKWVLVHQMYDEDDFLTRLGF